MPVFLYSDLFRIRRKGMFDFTKNNGGIWRQAGGKYYVRTPLADLFPTGVPIYSGMFGGGNVEYILAGRGHSVRGYEKSFLIANFCQEALVRARELADHIEINYLGRMNKDFFHKIEAELKQNPPPGFSTAAKTWVVNRCCRDGLLLNGGYSTTKRLRLEAIERLRQFSYPNVTVEQADFRDSLPKNAHRHKIMDPPYFSANGSLYWDRDQADLHSDFPHVDLAEMLRQEDKWILTYDDVPEVRLLYEGFRKTRDIQWGYRAGGRGRRSNELIIVSDDLEVPDIYEWVRD
jgi:DNA adenine methylase